jgi:hypothetical protein
MLSDLDRGGGMDRLDPVGAGIDAGQFYLPRFVKVASAASADRDP